MSSINRVHFTFQVSFQQTFEAKRSNHLAELQSKEDEMRQMFVLRVKEKEAELKESEKEVGFGSAKESKYSHLFNENFYLHINFKLPFIFIVCF